MSVKTLSPQESIGHELWKVLHNFTLTLRPEADNKNWFETYFMSKVPTGGSCRCKENWQEELKANPPPYDKDMFPWSMDRHDSVNVKKGKERSFLKEGGTLDYDAGRAFYSGKLHIPQDGYEVAKQEIPPEAIIDAIANNDGLPKAKYDNRLINGNLTKDEIYNLFDKVYIISLKRRPERLQLFNDRLKTINWPFKPPEVFEAIDGDAVGKNSTWGCRESHAECLKDAIVNGYTSVLILEDDAYITDNFDTKVAEFLAKVPEWDGLWFGNEHRGSFELVTDGVLRATNPHRLHCYGLRGPAIRDMFNWLKYGPRAKNQTEWWKDHADHVTGEMLGKNYRIYFPDPVLAAQRGGYSDIRGQEKPFEWFSSSPKVLPYIGDKVIHLTCNRLVREELRGLGLHGGFSIGQNGADNWINYEINKEPRTTYEKLADWLEVIRNEAAMNGTICTVWHPEPLPDFMLDSIKKAAGNDWIEIKVDSVDECKKKIAEFLTPKPDTENKIFAITSIRNGGIELLPHWLEHYKNLGVDLILVGLFDEVDEEKRKEIAVLQEKYGFKTYRHTWIGDNHHEAEGRNEEERRQACRNNGAVRNTWIVHTDLDELHTYPLPLKELLSLSKQKNIRCIHGNFLDRVAVNGDLPGIKESPSIFEQYPYGTRLTKNILLGWEHKVMVARYEARMIIGHHTATNYGKKFYPIGTEADYKVNHFRWTGNLIDRMRWGLASPITHEAWKNDTRNFLKWYEDNNGRIDLTDPRLETRLVN